jgi:hypothetical protein
MSNFDYAQLFMTIKKPKIDFMYVDKSNCFICMNQKYEIFGSKLVCPKHFFLFYHHGRHYKIKN